ncbi:MAG: STAS domain-containing protein [Deltaproteobacteria bacterium]|nr:STAS domain-containing protein [Deltaproteobacteria bacterium]
MLRKTFSEGLVWFSLNGSVGLTDIADFLREMSKEIHYGNRVFVLDISGGEHIQRHAFDSLINIKNKLKKDGVRLIILCAKKTLIDILNVERVPEHFEVISDTAVLKNQYSYANSYSSYRN